METLFIRLTDAMSGAPWLAVLAATGWGVASLVLSPCHLASIPLIVGFIGDRGRTAPRQALVLALLFALGILGAIAAVGGVTAVAGRMLGDVGPWANYGVAAVLVMVGLHLLGVLPLTFGCGPTLPRYRGKMAALLLGFVFGLALGPCTFAYLAPVLGVVFSEARRNPGYAFLLLLAYGVGHCLIIVLAGVSTGQVQRVLHWHESSRSAVWLKRICGMLVLLAGGWLVHTAS
ncbi:MAG: cytochrome c biogenesis protein CcdA [Opitutaceae bacterium]|nr:cytochrome c biogenesis protein CcdA [Opitutaceae bacterium]